MVSILHLIRDARDHRAFETVVAHAREGMDRVLLVLLHDAVLPGPHRSLGVPTRLFAADCAARGLPVPADAVDEAGLVALLFEHDRVILW
ncbi:MAG: hypothetical protein HYZ53_19975 [Planctomycetes bacterium]|nr:hypothetical protein [Planctomycetota bacterium]